MVSRLPDELRAAMKVKGWAQNPNALATKCGVPRMTMNRLFNGQHQHTALLQALRIADALEMTMEDFCHVATTLEPALIGDLIKGRLKRLGKSDYIFGLEISDGKHSAGTGYTTGGVKWDRLHIYYTISEVLQIPMCRLCEILLMRKPLYTTHKTATVITLPSLQLTQELF